MSKVIDPSAVAFEQTQNIAYRENKTTQENRLSAKFSRLLHFQDIDIRLLVISMNPK